MPRPLQVVGMLTGFGIVLDGAPSYLMGAGVVYNSELGGGSGILNGSITFNMTPAPVPRIVGHGRIGSSQTILSIPLSNDSSTPAHAGVFFCLRHEHCFVFKMSKYALRISQGGR